MPMYHLFEAFGIELEYMIVDASTLAVRPLADRLISAEGNRKNNVDRGDYAWSNELVAHVVELKTARPVRGFDGLAAGFQAEIGEIEARLEPHHCRLLPGGLHPWMDPLRETVLWPHDDEGIYATFDRIFDCHGHGWSNLQSCHVNLPFNGDDEFRRLHSAIRLVLPLIPALAASSPVIEARRSGLLDYRLKAYGENCARFPSISARLIPDVVRSEAEYVERIYRPIAADLASADPEGVLDPIWVNARGAIARFDRRAIEIRLLDTQECPAGDLRLVRYLVDLLKNLVSEANTSLAQQEAVATEELAALLASTIRAGAAAEIDSDAVWAAFGVVPKGEQTVAHLLGQLAARLPVGGDVWPGGCLAERLLTALPKAAGTLTFSELLPTYQRLADCLRHGQPFDA